MLQRAGLELDIGGRQGLQTWNHRNPRQRHFRHLGGMREPLELNEWAIAPCLAVRKHSTLRLVKSPDFT